MPEVDQILEAEQSIQKIASELSRMRDAAILLQESHTNSETVITTAKEIIELRQGLPGERFSKLDQLKAVKRIDWDEVFSTGEVYVE